MTRAHDSGVRLSWSPSRSGFSSCPGGATTSVIRSLRLHGVTAELVAKGGVDLGGERLVLPRREPRVQRRSDRRRGNALVDRLEDRPAALARVLDVALDLLQLRAVLLESVVQELQQPAPDHRAVAPDPRDLVQVELELGSVHDLEALTVGLHEAVLDSV